MKFYGLKSCDTCRKALALLRDRNVEVFDVRTDGVPEVLLSEWVETLGADKLINRRSRTWRDLSEAERQSDPVTLMRAHPTVMRRPVIVLDEEVLVGWSPEVSSRFS